ncbi:Pol I core factor CF [Lambiella insularis]|nr:Pol I core factor CF [Lambiella insularis]
MMLTDLVAKEFRERRATDKKKPLEGRQAFELFLQCYQLILRKQSYRLVHDKKFPPEFEAIVRDLWALWLQLIEEEHGKISETTDTESVLYSSQSEYTETDDEPTKEKSTKEKGLPTLIDTLGLCYLGAMLLRLPLTIATLHRWTIVEEIPYIVCLRHIPQEMKSRLPVHYQNVLNIRTPLGPDNLHTCVHQLAALYRKKFGLELPPLNYPPILFGFILQLALPLDVYDAVRQIASTLTCNFDFPVPAFRQRVSTLPEIQLLAMLVVTVKLYYPFDSIERHSRSLTDMGCLTIDWDVWNKAQEDYATKIKGDKPFIDGSEVLVNEHDVFDLSNQQIDAYLDWYEKTWIDPESKESSKQSISQELLDMFPTGRAETTRLDHHIDKDAEARTDYDILVEKLTTVQKGLKVRSVVSEAQEGKQREPVSRVGSSYEHYRHVSDLPSQARAFYEAAAKVAIISLSTLVAAVYKTELRLRRRRKEELFKEREEDTADEMATAFNEATLYDVDTDPGHYSSEDNSSGEQAHAAAQADYG